MSPYTLPLALITFLSFAVTTPIMFFFLNTYASSLPIVTRFLAYLVPPVVVVLYIAGWVQPGGA